MKYLNKVYVIVIALLSILMSCCVYFYDETKISENKKVDLVLNVSATAQADYDLYYGNDETELLDKINKDTCSLKEDLAEQNVVFSIGAQAEYAQLHFGNRGAVVEIRDAYLLYKQNRIELQLGNLFDLNKSYGVRTLDSYYNGDVWHIEVESLDSYIGMYIGSTVIIDAINKIDSLLYIICKIIFIVFFIAIGTVLIIKRRIILDYLKGLYKSRKLILSLSKNDFKTKYAGSYLGIIWAFVQPIITILVYWFVFSVGLRQGAVGKVPYALWLVSGLVPWFFFSDALVGGTNALIEYNYLVKKVVFNINILPIVKVLSAGFVHTFFVVFTVFLYTVLGYISNLYFLQLIYYSACIFALAIAIVYITSAVVVFFRDLTQVINIVLQIGIWMTPIMWQIKIIPESIRWFFYLNPFYYIVMGYRDSLIDEVLIIDRWAQGIYFWIIVSVLFIFGTRLFKKLQVHFADVL